MDKLLIGNTNDVFLIGLVHSKTGEIINDAVVTMRVLDTQGEEVPGTVWPQPIVYMQGTDGDYAGVIKSDLIQDPDKYYVEVTVEEPGGSIAKWTRLVAAVIRK